jgi:hypothetical protein
MISSRIFEALVYNGSPPGRRGCYGGKNLRMGRVEEVETGGPRLSPEQPLHTLSLNHHMKVDRPRPRHLALIEYGLRLRLDAESETSL